MFLKIFCVRHKCCARGKKSQHDHVSNVAATIGPFIRGEISRGLCNPRLIFPRINGPNVSPLCRPLSLFAACLSRNSEDRRNISLKGEALNDSDS